MNAREQIVTKLKVQGSDAQIKIEVTPVLRGCVFEPEVRAVPPAVEGAFGFAEMQVVSFSDLYAGKIMAALDRQHPRDLFDVRDLWANEGISDGCRNTIDNRSTSNEWHVQDYIPIGIFILPPIIIREVREIGGCPSPVEVKVDLETAIVHFPAERIFSANARTFLEWDRVTNQWQVVGYDDIFVRPSSVPSRYFRDHSA